MLEKSIGPMTGRGICRFWPPAHFWGRITNWNMAAKARVARAR